MKRLIPRNPNYKSPDRRYTVVLRLLMGIGGTAVFGASIAIMQQLEPLSGDREMLKFPTIIGGFTLILAAAAELQERYQKSISPEDGEEDGGGWDWRNPDEPDSPNDPNGGGIKLIEEIEDYLRTQEPVLV